MAACRGVEINQTAAVADKLMHAHVTSHLDKTMLMLCTGDPTNQTLSHLCLLVCDQAPQ
jgi:hypothetical protein